MNIVFIVLLVALTGVMVALIVTGIISSQKISKKQLVLLEDVLPEQGGKSEERYRYECALRLTDSLSKYITIKNGKVSIYVKKG